MLAPASDAKKSHDAASGQTPIEASQGGIRQTAVTWWMLVFQYRLRLGVVGALLLLGAMTVALYPRDPGTMPVITVSNEEAFLPVIEPPLTLRVRIATLLARSSHPLSRRLLAWVAGPAAAVPADEIALVPGTVVRTFGGSGGGLKYTHEATTLQLHRNTHLKILSARHGKRFELLAGVLTIHAAPQPEEKPIQVITANGTVSVIGTTLTISTGGRSTRVRVTAGTVTLESEEGGKTVQIPAGQQVIAARKRALVPMPVQSITNHFGAGFIIREYWQNIPGMHVQDLVTNAALAKPADGTERISSFQAPRDGMNMDQYGARIRGFVHPPVSGEYTFWITADDTAELWLGSDDRPESRRLICEASEWSRDVHNWWHSPEQESEPILLEAGRRYYIEALHKEVGGGDFVAVGWQPPGAEIEVIPGADLSPWENVIATRP